MMDEYIKRESALAAIMGWGSKTKQQKTIKISRHEAEVLFAERTAHTLDAIMIDRLPAEDVAPVRHGEWLLHFEGVGHYFECSECHTNPCIYVTKNTKFCPNCGAKMDAEDNDD